MIKILSVLDILAAFNLVLIALGYKGFIPLFFVLYLAVKFILFFGFVSFIDLIGGFFIVLAMVGFVSVFSWIFVIWFLQKGIAGVLG